eukprot:5647775-Amphidinium_carterae.2
MRAMYFEVVAVSVGISSAICTLLSMVVLVVCTLPTSVPKWLRIVKFGEVTLDVILVVLVVVDIIVRCLFAIFFLFFFESGCGQVQRSSSIGKGADQVGKVLYKLRRYPRASGRLRLTARPPGPGRRCEATSGPEGTCADSGNESESEAVTPEATHECIIRGVPVSACALSSAALRMACCALTRPRACPDSCASSSSSSGAVADKSRGLAQWEKVLTKSEKCCTS